jgi:hypothetical protein
VVQAPELDEMKLRQMFGFGLMVNAALCATLFIGAQFIAGFFAEPRLTAIVQVLAANLSAESLSA